MIPKQSSCFSSPLLAIRCTVTTRGYRALSLRIHVGPFRLAVRSSQTPGEGRGIPMWSLADHRETSRIWYSLAKLSHWGANAVSYSLQVFNGRLCSVLGKIVYGRSLLRKPLVPSVYVRQTALAVNHIVMSSVLVVTQIKTWSEYGHDYVVDNGRLTILLITSYRDRIYSLMPIMQ